MPVSHASIDATSEASDAGSASAPSVGGQADTTSVPSSIHNNNNTFQRKVVVV